MGRPASIAKKSRLTLELSQAVRKRLDELRARTGAESATEVIRRALALYDVIVAGAAQGEVRLVMRKGGKEETILIPAAIV